MQAKLDPMVHFFVVHPTRWMREEMFPVMIRSEIPVYGLDNQALMPKLCHNFPGSVFCINAAHGSGRQEADWAAWLGTMSETLRRSNSTVIYLTRPEFGSPAERLKELGIRHAVLHSHQAPRSAMGQIHALATQFTAKSRRGAIRVSCAVNNLAVFNVQLNGQSIRGHIRDISSAGMAAVILDSEPAGVTEGDALPNIQLKLKGSLVMVNGTLAAVRHDAGRLVWVVLFRWAEDLRSKLRIQEYVSQRLEEEVESFLR